MTQPLPPHVTSLWAALEDVALPPLSGGAPEQVRDVIAKALLAPSPRAMLNQGMRRLKRRTATLRDLANWLADPSVITLTDKLGASASRYAWREAIGKMVSGYMPHRAFGMGRHGRRAAYRFTWSERAAIETESIIRTNGCTLEQAAPLCERRVVSIARTEIATGTADDAAKVMVRRDAARQAILDEREVRRARKQLRLADLSMSEVESIALFR